MAVTLNHRFVSAIADDAAAAAAGEVVPSNWNDKHTINGGANTRVLFDNSGDIGESARLTWDGTALVLGNASDATGVLKFKGTTSGTVSLSVADAAGTWTGKLPTSAGSNGQALVTDGGSPAQFSWGNPSAGAGGSNTQVQYNTGGSLAGITNVTANGTNLTGIRLDSAATLDWDNGSGSVGFSIANVSGGFAVFTPGNNFVFQQNGTHAQTFVTQNYNDGAGNSEQGFIGWGPNPNIFTIGTNRLTGTGVERPTWITGNGSFGQVIFKVGGLNTEGATAPCGLFAFPSGGRFLVQEQSIAGTNDVFFQAYPASTSGYGFLEAWTSAGLIVGTGNNSNPVFIWVNRTEVARFTSSKLQLTQTILGSYLSALGNGAAAQTATLTNGPSAGNPTKWVPIDDNGTTRYIPAW